jgi:hypothetical protein
MESIQDFSKKFNNLDKKFSKQRFLKKKKRKKERKKRKKAETLKGNSSINQI